MPEEVRGNVFDMTEEERHAIGIHTLPKNLNQAIHAFEADEFVQKVLGSHASKKFIEAKKREWEEYRSHVSEWEIGEYLYKI